MMSRKFTTALLFATTLLASPVFAAGKTDAVTTIGWSDLVPADARKDLFNPAKVDHSKGPERPRSSPLGTQDSLDTASSAPAAPTVSTYDNRQIKMPGYVVPVDYDKDGRIIRFFLVPYFGACTHVPAPPTNQIVYVRYPQGFQPAALYEPFWVTGTLKVEAIHSELAESGYSMNGIKIEPYSKPKPRK